MHKLVLRIPSRKPDFDDGLWKYWFDEMIAYSDVMRYKGRLNTLHYEKYKLMGLRISYGSGGNKGSRWAPPEVNNAYMRRVEISFEEEVLNAKDT